MKKNNWMSALIVLLSYCIIHSKTMAQSCTPPDVTQPPNQTVNNNNATAAVTFSGSVPGTVFNWTNDNPSIGLPASGTGNIASFTALNSGSLPVTATVTVTPVVIAAFAYIPNNNSNNVSVINTSTNTVVTTIPVGSGPYGVAASLDGSKVYIANDGDGNVSVINTATNTVTATVGVGTNPTCVAVSPDGSKVYVTNYNSNNVSVIDAATNTVVTTVGVGTNPFGVAVSPDGSKIFVVNLNSDNVSVINGATNSVVTTVAVGSGPALITLSPDGSKVYVTNISSNNVSVISTATNSVINTLGVGTSPDGIAISPDGSRLYVANQGSSNLSVINTSTNTVIATVGVGSAPCGVSVTPDGSEVYVVNLYSNTVSVISTATNTVMATVDVGSVPVSFGNFISGSSGCTGTPKSFTITVNPTTVSNINLNVCSIPTRTIYRGTTSGVGPFGPQSVNLASTVTGGTPPYTYQWSPAAGLSNVSISNPVADPQSTTTYTLTVTDSYGNSRSLSITINVLPLSAAICSGSGNNVKFNVCHISPGNPSNPQNICISVNALPAHLTSGNNGHNNCYLGPCQQNCFSTTPGGSQMPTYVNSVTELAADAATVKDKLTESNDDFKVQVYPNPSSGEFNIKVFTRSNEPIMVRILDNYGIVRSVSFLLSKNNTIKAGSKLISGTYMAEVIQGNNRKVVKLIKLN